MQQACCGDPFAVGDHVTWRISAAGVERLHLLLGDERAAHIAGAEDHHDVLPEPVPISGRVTEILAVVSRDVDDVDVPQAQQARRPGRRPQRIVRPSSGSSIELLHVHSTEQPLRALAGSRLEGYLVRLDVDDQHGPDAGRRPAARDAGRPATRGR